MQVSCSYELETLESHHGLLDCAAMEPLKSTLFYVNPAAGSGRASVVWRALAETMPARATSVLDRDPAVAGARLVDELAHGSFERVIAVGGDGTAHTVANLLIESNRARQVAFGLVPSGTGSDLARTLGLPRRPPDALRFALAQAPHPLDVLRLTCDSGWRRQVINIASGGVSGTVAMAVNALPRRGAFAYLGATLRALRWYRAIPCRVLADGEVFFDGKFFVVAIANGQFFGKGMRVAPRAVPDDGLADVVVVPEVPLWQLPHRLPQFVTGRHLDLPIVRYTRARRVRLEPAEGFPPYELDGEMLAAQPVEVEVLPGALRFLYRPESVQTR